jgi:hypothetical protein
MLHSRAAAQHGLWPWPHPGVLPLGTHNQVQGVQGVQIATLRVTHQQRLTAKCLWAGEHGVHLQCGS